MGGEEAEAGEGEAVEFRQGKARFGAAGTAALGDSAYPSRCGPGGLRSICQSLAAGCRARARPVAVMYFPIHRRRAGRVRAGGVRRRTELGNRAELC